MQNEVFAIPHTASLIYKPRIDGLRCVAVASVMLYHYINWLGVPISAGPYGVNLFFVLSGFLITSILIKDGDEPFRMRYFNFMGRRILRIFPIYYLTLFVLYVLDVPHINDRIGYLATYTYNFIVTEINWTHDPFGHFWSLCVEEQFYLIFPFVAIGLRKKPDLLLAICICFVIVAYLQIFFDVFNMAARYSSLHYFNYTSLLTNMGPLCLGSMAAIILKNRKMPAFFNSGKLELFAVGLMLLTNSFLEWKFQILICSVLNLFLVVKAYYGKFSIGKLDKFLTNNYVVYFGRISYGLYVYHLLVSSYLDEFVIDPLWLRIPFENFGVFSKLEFHPWFFKSILYTFVTILIASYSYLLIEMPILKLKDRFFQDKKLKPAI